MTYRGSLVAMLALCLAGAAAGADEAQSPPPPEERNARINYLIYSLEIGDPAMPTNRDAKVRIGLKDKAAKDLYQHLAPIPFDGCGVAPGTRVRGTPNGKVVCVRSAKAEYWCSIAVDLKTGESVGAMVC